MFGLTFERLLVLAVVGLFVLGPERLPAAASWLGQALRKVKGFAEGAQQQVRRELGPEFEQLREPLAQLRAPLQELQALRDPRVTIMRHLLGDTPPDTASGPSKPGTAPPSPTTTAAAAMIGTTPVPRYDPDAT